MAKTQIEVMREAVNTPTNGWMESIIWVKTPDRIIVDGLWSVDGYISMYRRAIADAIGRGGSIDEIWTYWAKNGGNMYFNERTMPEIVYTDSVDVLIDSEVRRMNKVWER